MIGRWAGIRGPARKNRNPNENVMTRDEQEVSDPLYSERLITDVKDAEIDEDSDVVLEPAKSIPVHDKCEVLVVGGGPSGEKCSVIPSGLLLVPILRSVRSSGSQEGRSGRYSHGKVEELHSHFVEVL